MNKDNKKQCLDLFLKIFIALLSPCTIGSFGESFVSNSKGPIKCVSLNNLPDIQPS